MKSMSTLGTAPVLDIVSHLSFGVNIQVMGFFREEIPMFERMEGSTDFCYYQKLYKHSITLS